MCAGSNGQCAQVAKEESAPQVQPEGAKRRLLMYASSIVQGKGLVGSGANSMAGTVAATSGGGASPEGIDLTISGYVSL